MPETGTLSQSNTIAEDGEIPQDVLNEIGQKIELSSVNKPGAIVSQGKLDLSLLKMLSVGSEKYNESQIWRVMSFLDGEEALDHVAAFHEAQDLGMDTSFNINFAYSLCSANRKGNFVNNLVAILTDTMQNAKWANNQRVKTNDSSTNPRSPLRTT